MEIENELKQAIVEEMISFGDLNEVGYFLYTKFDENKKRYSLVYDFIDDKKILYQAEKYKTGNIVVQRVYIIKDMLDVF